MDPRETLPEPDRLPDAPHPCETVRLFGQERAQAELEDAISSGRLHHAWMFCGPPGVGKATMAYRLARRLIADPLGRAGPGFEPPSACATLTRIRAGSEPRLLVLRRAVNEKTGKLRTRITIDEVRKIRSFLGLSTPDGGWRVVIVDAADEMNANAANALLKLLEEPPSATVIVLITQSVSVLLPTIRSRCRPLDFAPLGSHDLASALEQVGFAPDPSDAHALAELAGGSVGRALTLTAGGGLTHYAAMVRLLLGYHVDRQGLAALADQAAGRERETVFPMISELLLTLLSRVARACVLGPPQVWAAPEEMRLFSEIARTPEQAPIWAEAAMRAASTIRHARAVNLDPGQTIIDMFLDLDGTRQAAARLV